MPDEYRADLVRRYPYNWVTITTNGKLITGDLVDELIQKLTQKGLRRDNIVVRFMAAAGRPMIL